MEKDGDKVKHIVLRGDGNLSVVSALTLWQWGFEIDIDTSRFMSYSTNDYQGSHDIKMVPQLQLLGLGYVVQNLKGLFFDLFSGTFRVNILIRVNLQYIPQCVGNRPTVFNLLFSVEGFLLRACQQFSILY